MRQRSPIAITILAALFAAFLLAPSALAQAQSVAAKPAVADNNKIWTLPKTPDGVPDLQGYWTNQTNSPLERPPALGAKEFYTPEELEQRDKAARDAALRRAEAGQSGVHYDVAQFGLDSTHSKTGESERTSIVVGTEGRIPALLPEAAKRQADRQAVNRGPHQWDGPENRALGERCILWPNEGPPMLPEGYNSNLEIVQGPGYVAIEQEMIHDVRIIPTDGRSHAPANVRSYLGDPVGHWEGNTLVVDTTNFNGKAAFHGSDENLEVIERFTRTADDTILYQFTISDPTTWSKPWSGELPISKIAGPIYEYACQEGNYGMANILSGARATEKEAAQKKD
jgi:hypothetical protein